MVVSTLLHNFCEHIFFKLLDQQCQKFSKGYAFSVFTELRFSIVVVEILNLEWQCSQYLELNPIYLCVVYKVHNVGIFVQLPMQIGGDYQ